MGHSDSYDKLQAIENIITKKEGSNQEFVDARSIFLNKKIGNAYKQLNVHMNHETLKQEIMTKLIDIIQKKSVNDDICNHLGKAEEFLGSNINILVNSKKQVIKNLSAEKTSLGTTHTPRPYQQEAIAIGNNIIDGKFGKTNITDAHDKPDYTQNKIFYEKTMSSGKTLVVGHNIQYLIQHIEQFNLDHLTILLVADKINTINNQIRQLTTPEGNILPSDIRDQIMSHAFHSRNEQEVDEQGLISAKVLLLASTYQSMEDEQLRDILSKRGGVDAVWIDEAHHFSAPSWKKNVDNLLLATTGEKLPLYIFTTGTVKKELIDLVGNPDFRYSLAEYLLSPYSPQFNYEIITHADVTQKEVTAIYDKIYEINDNSQMRAQKEFNKHKNTLQKLVLAILPTFNSLDSMIQDMLFRTNNDLQGSIMYVDSKKDADQLSDHICQKFGLDSKSYHSGNATQKDSFDKDTLQLFLGGELQIIIVIGMLDESIHPTTVNHAFTMSKIQSPIKIFQRLGRLLGSKMDKVTLRDYSGSFRNFFHVQLLKGQMNHIKSKYNHQKKNGYGYTEIEPLKEKLKITIPYTPSSHIIHGDGPNSSTQYSLGDSAGVAFWLKDFHNKPTITKERILQDLKEKKYTKADLGVNVRDTLAQQLNQNEDGVIYPRNRYELIRCLGGDPYRAMGDPYLFALLDGREYTLPKKKAVSLEQLVNYYIAGKITAKHLTDWKERMAFALQENTDPFSQFTIPTGIGGLRYKVVPEKNFNDDPNCLLDEFNRLSGNVQSNTIRFATANDYGKLVQDGSIDASHLSAENWIQFTSQWNEGVKAKKAGILLYNDWNDFCKVRSTPFVEGIWNKLLQQSNLKLGTSHQIVSCYQAGGFDFKIYDPNDYNKHVMLWNMGSARKYGFFLPMNMKALETICNRKRKNMEQRIKSLGEGITILYESQDYLKAMRDGLITDEWLSSEKNWYQHVKKWNSTEGKKTYFKMHEKLRSFFTIMCGLSSLASIETPTAIEGFNPIFQKIVSDQEYDATEDMHKLGQSLLASFIPFYTRDDYVDMLFKKKLLQEDLTQSGRKKFFTTYTEDYKKESNNQIHDRHYSILRLLLNISSTEDYNITRALEAVKGVLNMLPTFSSAQGLSVALKEAGKTVLASVSRLAVEKEYIELIKTGKIDTSRFSSDDWEKKVGGLSVNTGPEEAKRVEYIKDFRSFLKIILHLPSNFAFNIGTGTIKGKELCKIIQNGKKIDDSWYEKTKSDLIETYTTPTSMQDYQDLIHSGVIDETWLYEITRRQKTEALLNKRSSEGVNKSYYLSGHCKRLAEVVLKDNENQGKNYGIYDTRRAFFLLWQKKEDILLRKCDNKEDYTKKVISTYITRNPQFNELSSSWHAWYDQGRSRISKTGLAGFTSKFHRFVRELLVVLVAKEGFSLAQCKVIFSYFFDRKTTTFNTDNPDGATSKVKMTPAIIAGRSLYNKTLSEVMKDFFIPMFHNHWENKEHILDSSSQPESREEDVRKIDLQNTLVHQETSTILKQKNPLEKVKESFESYINDLTPDNFFTHLINWCDDALGQVNEMPGSTFYKKDINILKEILIKLSKQGDARNKHYYDNLIKGAIKIGEAKDISKLCVNIIKYIYST